MLNEQFHGVVNATNIADYAKQYIDVLSNSYSWSFAVACVSLIISLVIFFVFRKTYIKATLTEKEKANDKERASEVVELTPAETKKRLTALGLVFFVVIFFWMSFHQNGSTMTFFARDYTVKAVGQFDSLWFTLKAMVPAIVAFYGFYFAFTAKTQAKKLAGGIVGLAFVGVIWAIFAGQPAMTKISPQIFQQFNPFYIIILTPIFIALFSWLNSKGKEPSAPRKIGFGMLIAGMGFVLLMIGSFGLPAPSEIVTTPIAEGMRVTPYWLMGTYLILTCAELFLSPMGISFVSKVAPPKYKGLMQGGWFAATAVGNYLVGVLGGFWERVDLPVFWGILIVCTVLSAIFIFSQMKRLESASE
jgi:POT family proton-dependent oligopeptide transporter